MAINLDPKNTALLVIDVQNGLFSRPTPIYKGEELLENINSLSDRFARSGGTIFFIQHSNQKLLLRDSENWRLHADLDVDGNDLVIHKTHGNAFEETELENELDARGIKNLVVTGLVTNGCVKATCMGGKELGYRVILVEDGHSSYIKTAPRLIKEWNRKLAEGIVDLYPTSAIFID